MWVGGQVEDNEREDGEERLTTSTLPHLSPLAEEISEEAGREEKVDVER